MDASPMPSIDPIDRDLKRKRSRSSDDRVQSAKKRRQHNHPDNWVPSERFWDNLSKIHLTRRALTEHNRRNRVQNSNSEAPAKEGPPQRQSTRLRQAARRKQSLSLSRDNRESTLELQRFARHGGPGLFDIRGFPDPTMSHNKTSRPSKRTTTSGRTTSSKRSGPYDKNYELKLAQVGIHLTEETDENDEIVLPSNYDDLTTRLNNTRESLSPSRFTEEDFQRFRLDTRHEILEGGTMSKSVAAIEGNGEHIYSRMGGPFNNLQPFSPELAMAVPDSYDGAPPLNIDHRVLNDLDSSIIPSTDMSRPAAPNFFLEGKSRGGRADVAQRQAAHSGAIGARAMMSLQSYPSEALTYDGNSYSFTGTYHDGQLKMYTTHASAPDTRGQPPQYHRNQINQIRTHATAPEPRDQPSQYHMTQIGAFAMTNSSKTFREGATYYRNARDLAKEQRDMFIQNANQMARRMPTSEYNGRVRRTVNTKSGNTSIEEEGEGEGEGEGTSSDELTSSQLSKRSRSGWQAEQLQFTESDSPDPLAEDTTTTMSFASSSAAPASALAPPPTPTSRRKSASAQKMTANVSSFTKVRTRRV